MSDFPKPKDMRNSPRIFQTPWLDLKHRLNTRQYSPDTGYRFQENNLPYTPEFIYRNQGIQNGMMMLIMILNAIKPVVKGVIE